MGEGHNREPVLDMDERVPKGAREELTGNQSGRGGKVIRFQELEGNIILGKRLVEPTRME